MNSINQQVSKILSVQGLFVCDEECHRYTTTHYTRRIFYTIPNYGEKVFEVPQVGDASRQDACNWLLKCLKSAISMADAVYVVTKKEGDRLDDNPTLADVRSSQGVVVFDCTDISTTPWYTNGPKAS